MVAIKTQQAASFVAKPDPSYRAILVFGNDAGLVSERAKSLTARLSERENPPGEIIRIEETDLDQDPDRLSIELLTVPMFGGPKIVRATAGRRINTNLLKPLIEGPPLPGALVVEAGSLRADESLRALFEKAPSAAAIACYADEDGSLATLINEVVGAAGLKITPEARTDLVSRLGADRGLSRSEIEKLTLYAANTGTITVEHVDAIVGDAAELAIDKIVEAAAMGDIATALSETDRSIASGESAQTIILALQRHFQRLHRTKVGIENGRALDDMIRQIRPPLHFKMKAAFERQCRLWPADRLGQALTRIADAAKSARLNSALEATLAERLMLELARLSRIAAATGQTRRS